MATEVKKGFHLPRPPVADPASVLGYPPTFPIEVALRTRPVPELCKVYGISSDEWARLIRDDVFRNQVQAYLDLLEKEGMSFKLKAMLQSEELLSTSFQLIHDVTGDVPPSVKADLIKHTHKVAGLVPGNNEGGGNSSVTVPVQVIIDLS